ncbi:hypothetical protein ACLB2K_020797 [Fragaria x ananassa]
MDSSSSSRDEILFEDNGIIEAKTICFEDNTESADFKDGISLLGILIADEEPGLGVVKAALMGMWKALGQIRIVRVKMNTYCLSVGLEKLASKLLNDSLWSVKGLCFTIKHWPRYQSIDAIITHRATYWIQGHGVPWNQINKSNGRKLGCILGSVMEVEDPVVTGNRGYLRIRVDFDTRNPLATFIQLPRPGMSMSEVRLEYEGLKNFCFKCGRVLPISTRQPWCIEGQGAGWQGLMEESHRAHDSSSVWDEISDRVPPIKEKTISLIRSQLSCNPLGGPHYWDPDAHGALF